MPQNTSVNVKSQLRSIIDSINSIPEYEEKKAATISGIQDLNIKDEDKRRLLMVVKYQCPNSYKLTTYLYNAMLKFEGLGVV